MENYKNILVFAGSIKIFYNYIKDIDSSTLGYKGSHVIDYVNKKNYYYVNYTFYTHRGLNNFDFVFLYGWDEKCKNNKINELIVPYLNRGSKIINGKNYINSETLKIFKKIIEKHNISLIKYTPFTRFEIMDI